MNAVNEEAAGTLAAGLVVVGGGGAGLAAAVAAAQSGLRVTLIEKRGTTGGNTIMSSGMFAADSSAQRRQLIDGRPEYFFKVMMEFAHWKCDPRIVWAYISKSADTIRWLEKMGLTFDVFPMYPNQIPTWHQARNKRFGGRGAEVVKVLSEEMRNLGVRVLTYTQAQKILLDDGGSVRGIVTERYGKQFVIEAENIVLATGGYGANRELLKKHAPLYRDDMLCDGLPMAGDGLIMAMEAGADTEGLGLLLMSGPQIPNAITLSIGDPPDTFPVPLMALSLEPNTLWVNKKGERFCDEAVGYNHYVSANAVNRQPDNLCYALLSREIVQTMTDDGLIMGLGGTRILQRTAMPGLERELRKQAEHGLMSVAQTDYELCTGCGTCVSSCPLDAISLDTAAKDEFPPCRIACPAAVDMRRYMQLVKTGMIEDAYRVLRESLPLPAVTGRVCPHFCEADCARHQVDEAVDINAVERFVADRWLKEKPKPVARTHGERIAIVGSGSAGLSCAYFLIRLGYGVTVFEAMPLAGGMLRVGIPAFRLPRDVLEEQIRYIEDLGVEFQTGVTVGKDISLDTLRREYQAVFLATGCQRSRKIEIQGSELDGVYWGLDFLRSVNLHSEVRVGRKVVVIGGGNVAIDAALSALRAGAEEVRIACLEARDQMPAFQEGIADALAEGVAFHTGWGPKQILGDGKRVTGVEFWRCLRVVNDAGRFDPCFDETSTEVLLADAVVLAIGQMPDRSLLPKALRSNHDGLMQVDETTRETTLAGVFAGGDVVGGTSVVEALAHGKEAALSIELYLKRQDLRQGRETRPEAVKSLPGEGMTRCSRIGTPMIPVAARAGGAEIRTGLAEDLARQAAERCMTCGSRPLVVVGRCQLCRSCLVSCPVHAMTPVPLREIRARVKVSPSLDEIARWIGADHGMLRTTVAAYNDACAHGHDPIYGKDPKYLVPLLTPPYFAIEANSDYLDTIGGLKVNENMEVLNTKGQRIPGLYAAGVMCGGWQGDTYCVILSGAASAFAINSGRIAAESVVGRLKAHD